MIIDFNTLTLEKAFRFCLLEYASTIEYKFSDLLKPAPNGIYIKNRLEPVMVEGKKYFSDLNGRTVLVTDVNLHTSAIYDENDVVVIPRAFMLDKSKYLSNSSDMPYSSLKIIEEIIKHYVYSKLLYMKDNNSDKLIKSISEYLIITDKEKIEEMLVDCFEILLLITNDVSEFISDKTWNIHYVNVEGTSIRIDRYEDFRIHEWKLWTTGKLKSSSLSKTQLTT